jgi:hypothetical protein
MITGIRIVQRRTRECNNDRVLTSLVNFIERKNRLGQTATATKPDNMPVTLEQKQGKTQSLSTNLRVFL